MSDLIRRLFSRGEGRDAVQVWLHDDTDVVIADIDGEELLRLTPAEARALARLLFAAADQGEGREQ